MSKKKKKLYVHILLDRSGSMEDCRDTTIGAVNEYVNSLRSDSGLSARVSLTLFDDMGFDLVFDRQTPGSMPRLSRDSFVPRGRTPLNDAIGRTVADIDKAALEKGESVVFVILTDGLENASREHTRNTVRLLIEDRQKTKNWLVIYLGANQDAFAEGAARGMTPGSTMTFDTEHVGAAVAAVARASKAFAHEPVAASAAFTPSERAKARR